MLDQIVIKLTLTLFLTTSSLDRTSENEHENHLMTFVSIVSFRKTKMPDTFLMILAEITVNIFDTALK